MLHDSSPMRNHPLPSLSLWLKPPFGGYLPPYRTSLRIIYEPPTPHVQLPPQYTLLDGPSLQTAGKLGASEQATGAALVLLCEVASISSLMPTTGPQQHHQNPAPGPVLPQVSTSAAAIDSVYAALSCAESLLDCTRRAAKSAAAAEGSRLTAGGSQLAEGRTPECSVDPALASLAAQGSCHRPPTQQQAVWLRELFIFLSRCGP